MDPLSDIISLIKTRHHYCGALDAGGRWCIHFQKFEGVRFYAVVRGSGWLAVEGIPAPISVEEGDCFLFPRGEGFLAGSDLSLEPLDGLALFRDTRNTLVTVNGGGDVFGISGLFTTSGEHANLLLGLLPPLLLIRREADREVLRWALAQLHHELSAAEHGSALMTQQLSTMVLIQVVRLHLAQDPGRRTGWLSALVDKRLGLAISAIHSNPGRRWTLSLLASEAGMSRTSFAVRFKEVVGQSPMEYLTQWRMLLAADRLASTDSSISEIAPSLGYESESAFNSAFKRVMGYPPRQYSRRSDDIALP